MHKSLNCVEYVAYSMTVHTCAASDHYPIAAAIQVLNSTQPKSICKRNFKNLNALEFQNRLLNIAIESAPNVNVNHMVDNWYAQINEILSELAPYKNYPYKKNY